MSQACNEPKDIALHSVSTTTMHRNWNKTSIMYVNQSKGNNMELNPNEKFSSQLDRTIYQFEYYGDILYINDITWISCEYSV